MDLTAIIKAVSASQELQATGDACKGLVPGDMLTAKVISVENDGRVLVDVGRSRLMAQISFSVKPGQLLDLQVLQAGRILHFRAVGSEGRTLKAPMPRVDFSQVLTKTQLEQFSLLLEQLTSRGGSRQSAQNMPVDVMKAFAQVKTLFDAIPMEQPVDRVVQWIKAAIEDRGIFFEKKLVDIVARSNPASVQDTSDGGHSIPTRALITSDVKPQLLMLREFLNEPDDSLEALLKLSSKDVDTLRHGVGRLLEHVTQQQEKAVARWQAGETQQVMIHLWPLEPQPMPVELKVYYPKRGGCGEGRQQHHIALLLDMDQLGLVRVDLAQIAEQLHISFFVGSEELKACFQAEIQAVKEALAGTFAHLQVEVYLSREKIAEFHEDDIKGAAAGRVDIKA